MKNENADDRFLLSKVGAIWASHRSVYNTLISREIVSVLFPDVPESAYLSDRSFQTYLTQKRDYHPDFMGAWEMTVRGLSARDEHVLMHSAHALFVSAPRYYAWNNILLWDNLNPAGAGGQWYGERYFDQLMRPIAGCGDNDYYYPVCSDIEKLRADLFDWRLKTLRNEEIRKTRA